MFIFISIFFLSAAQSSLLHRHCLCYFLHVKGTFYLTSRYYGLSLLRILNKVPERVRYSESWLYQGSKHVPKLRNCNLNCESENWNAREKWNLPIVWQWEMLLKAKRRLCQKPQNKWWDWILTKENHKCQNSYCGLQMLTSFSLYFFN